MAGVILAAGEGRRFGGEKLLAPFAGTPLVQRVIDAACASSVDEVVLVLGHAAETLRRSIDPRRSRVVVNEGWADGQSGSLRLGLRAAAGADAAVVLLGDQPRVTAALVDALIARQRASGAVAVICTADGRRSPPTLLHRSLWPEIDELTGDVGAREVLRGRADVVELEVTSDLGSLDDVDRPEDLR